MSMLSEKAKKLPAGPGVYVFTGKGGKVLYVGRATSLRRRVASYFTRPADLRIREMVRMAREIKINKTDTVLEAIILEANLIKKHWPKYNVKERDDRSFIYIVIPKTSFPKPLIVRGKELGKFPSDKTKVFGPYQSLSLVKNALKIIRRVFPYSTCKPFSGKPCFDYQIGLCPGACVGAVSEHDYRKNIKDITLFLSGQKRKLLKKLQKENPEKVSALKHIQDVSLITREEFENTEQSNRIEGYDISHLGGKETYGSMVVFTGGKPDKEEYRLFKIKEAPANDDLKSLAEMLVRRFNHPEWKEPDLILIDGGKPQVDYVFKVFQKIHVNIPVVGISKYQDDKLIFPPKTKQSIKELTQNIKRTLLETRDEAHRFALKSSRRRRGKQN